MTAGADRHACAACGSSLDRPGDFCLVCRSANADAVVLDAAPDRTTLTMLRGEAIVGETTVTTTPEPDDELRPSAERTYAGRVADEIRRKRPEAVYAAGERWVVRAVRDAVRFPVYRVAGPDPVESALAGRGEPPLAVDDRPPVEKLGGRHTTLIGSRDGRRAVGVVAGHPHVKKVVPGAIDAGGTGSQRGLRVKATRADGNGNLRLLLRDGSSVQEVHVVTTATNRDQGERVRADLNDALRGADLA